MNSYLGYAAVSLHVMSSLSQVGLGWHFKIFSLALMVTSLDKFSLLLGHWREVMKGN